jgi:3-oxoacyl-[acyl-carrier protein] reductase
MLTADLSSRAALVTGGASGIGLATVRRLAACGARVAINDRAGNPRLGEAEAQLQAEGFDVVAVPGSVGDPEAAEAVVDSAVSHFGRLDYLVNNAGTSQTDTPIPPQDLDRLGEDFWREILSINLVGPFRCTRAAAPHLKTARGAVVNTASTAGYGYPGSSMAYAASKAGLMNLTTNLARALAPEVRVNAVAPGMIRTPWTMRFGQAWEDRSVEMTCLKRVGTAEDIAEVILFLLAGAAYVTGQTLRVDGGLG